MNARLTFVHTLSPLHAGTGQGTGVVDLPIAREKATGLPFLPGSSLKGTLRSLCDDNNRNLIFGPETNGIPTDSNTASPAQFSDQRLLLLPVRSLAGTFAWVTSPYVLRRFARDIEDAEITSPSAPIPVIAQTKQCHIANQNSKIAMQTNPQTVYLEDLDLEPQTSQEATNWASWVGRYVFPDSTDWQSMLVERICIVHDDVFSFLIDTSTEITARIKLQEDSKTVQEGGLWYEEALPTETILSGLILAFPPKASTVTPKRIFEVVETIAKNTVQLGGKATVGRGMCRIQLAKGEA